MSTDMQDLAARYQTLHLSADDVPYVQTGGPVRQRVLHAGPDGEFVVLQLNADPDVVSTLHLHNGPVFGWTNAGSWGHNKQFAYRPGTYIFETPGVKHRFMSGPNGAEALYVVYGRIDTIDEATGEIASSHGPTDVVKSYFRACEAAGLPRPNVLG